MNSPAGLTFSQIQGAAETPTEAQLVDALRRAPNLASAGQRPAAGTAIEALLRTSKSAKVRNAAALALVELRSPDASKAINSVLTRKDIALTGGTLLFALDELGAKVRPDAALNVLLHGSYEARAELLILLQKGLFEPFSETEGELAKHELRTLADGSDHEGSEAAEIALDLLFCS